MIWHTWTDDSVNGLEAGEYLVDIDVKVIQGPKSTDVYYLMSNARPVYKFKAREESSFGTDEAMKKYYKDKEKLIKSHYVYGVHQIIVLTPTEIGQLIQRRRKHFKTHSQKRSDDDYMGELADSFWSTVEE